MRISETDRQRAVRAAHAVKRGDHASYGDELDASIRDGGWLRFTYALAELAATTEQA